MFRKKYIELIGDSLICCWVVHDHNGELVYLNDNAETFFSISREELFAVRKEIEKWQLFDHHGQELEIDSFPVSIALKHGSYSKRLIGFKPPNQNEMKWCSVQAEKVMDPETSSSFVIVSFVDETELVGKNKMLRSFVGELEIREKRLEELNEQLKSTLWQRENLYSVLAHDLRSPFTTIVGFSEILESSTASIEPKKASEYASKIKKSAMDVLKMTDSILEWVTELKNLSEISVTEHDLLSTVKRACSVLEPYAKSKGVELQFNIEESLFLSTDHRMLGTIIRNLVNNAIKFSYEGRPVAIEISKSEQFHKISIVDRGMGMDEESVQRILSKRGEFSSPGTCGEKGSGLGLMLVMEFVQKIKGKLEIESQLGEGSRFIIYLPSLKT